MPKYEARFESTYSAVGPARRCIVNFAKSSGFFGQALHEIESAAGEALANAVEHGHTEAGGFTVKCAFENGCLVIDIHDQGRGFANWNESEPVPPRPVGTRGYGIFIMRRFMDTVSYTDGGRHLRLTKRLAANSRSPGFA